MFSMRLESRERKETVEYERRARDISDQLLGAVASDETLLNDPDWLGDILSPRHPGRRRRRVDQRQRRLLRPDAADPPSSAGSSTR